jgi:hypothetical protein
MEKCREAIGASRGPIADLYDMDRDADWTFHELQRDQTERGH